MTAFFSWQHAIRSSKLESTTKLVCYTIWSHMASDGTGCFPSYALIAEESGLSRRSVIDHVQKAAQAGFLQVDNRQRENGSATSNIYRPTMPGSEPAALGGERGSLGGGEPAAPLLTDHLSNNPPNIPQPPKGAEAVEGFDEFWSAYPRKVSKPDALKVWKRTKPDVAEVLAGLKRWKASEGWTKEDGKYIPYPATWLNRGQWNDAIAGEKVAPTASDMKAAEERIAAKRRENEERERLMVEGRRRQLGLVT